MNNKLQGEMAEWCRENFPDSDSAEQFLGIVEEVGELSHSILKRSQGIRGGEDWYDFREKARDAVGDIVIYLNNFCSMYGWSLEEIVSETWDKVKERNWKKFPRDGTNE